MDELILRAEPRFITGKKVKRLRREGRVPGVVYGPVVPETVSVAVDRREFERFFQAHGHSTLFKLAWDGREQSVFIHEVQVDPVRHTPLHIDFFAPNLRKEITASIPVLLHHPNPDAVGVLTHLRNEVEVRGLPADIPHQIEADISGLVAVGDALRVGDLTLPAGTSAATEADVVIAQLSAVETEIELEPVAEEEIEEIAEDAAAEAAAEGEGEEEATE